MGIGNIWISGKQQRILLILSFGILFYISNTWLINSVQAKAFERREGLATIAVGEVSGYGEYRLKQSFLLTFEELLLEKLQGAEELQLCMLKNHRNDACKINTMSLDEDLSVIHMDAIARGKYYVREKSDIRLVRYADKNIPGKYVKPAKKDEIYELSDNAKSILAQFYEAYGIQFLIFCNFKEVNIINKDHYDGSGWHKDIKGRKIKLDMDYYLVNSQTGKAFALHSFMDKTSQIIDIVFAKYGKQFTTQQLAHDVLENQAGRIYDSIISEGVKAVK